MSYNETEMAYKNGYENGYKDATRIKAGCCTECLSRDVCFILSATGGVPSCKHHLAPRRRAVWEERSIDGSIYWQCSECDFIVEERTGYCGGCGSEMAVVF